MFGVKGYLRCPNGVPQVLCAHFPQIFANGQWGKWTFEGRGYPKCSKGVPQMLCVHSPKIFANGQRGKLALGVLGKRRLLEERGTLSTLIVLIFPQWTLGQNGHWGEWALGAPNAYLKKLGGGHRTLGILLPQISICPKCPFAPVPISKNLVVTSIEHLEYPFRAFGAPLSPKCTFALNAHLPQCPFVSIWGKRAKGTWGTPLGHLRFLCPPNVHLPLVPICLGARLRTYWGNGPRALGIPI